MQKITAAEVDAHVADGMPTVGEEHQVPGLKVVAGDRLPLFPIVLAGSAAQEGSQGVEDLKHQAAAVEASGAAAMKPVGQSQKMIGRCMYPPQGRGFHLGFRGGAWDGGKRGEGFGRSMGMAFFGVTARAMGFVKRDRSCSKGYSGKRKQ
jgi:hypothetical protein